MLSDSDRKLLISCYRNFNARVIDAVLKVMHPEVDWPNGMEGGRVLGHDGVREYWSRQWTLIDPHVEPVAFRSGEGALITVSVHQVVRGLDGKVLADQMVEHAYHIEDGLIRSMHIDGENS